VPGMSTGLDTNDPTVVSGFHTALLHQGLFVLAVTVAISISWSILRPQQLRAAPTVFAARMSAEPMARKLLRITFGIIWIFDGLLQGQSSMPLGLVPQGIQPVAAASRSWVQHVVNFGTTIWNFHPVSAATASVWIQIGVGVAMLVAPRPMWSRVAGATSVGWGLLVWVFGEAFGGIFAPGLTWLFGAPGAVLFYCAAGLLIAAPEKVWVTARTGRSVLRSMGIFFLGMAVLEAWPGRGFWQGRTPNGTLGTLATMVQQMSHTPQPQFFASAVSAFAGFDEAHGWGVNLFVVAALAILGTLFVWGRPIAARAALFATILLCVADWLLVEDLGFFGGTGTDPNSMIPMVLLLIAGYLGMTRLPVVDGTSVVSISDALDRTRLRGSLRRDPILVFRLIATLGAGSVILLGVVPMAAATMNPDASSILSQAINGTPAVSDTPAPAFRLTDQFGRSVSLSSLKGKTVALTFLDPLCTSDCPTIAQEFKEADSMLGSQRFQVEMIAINANPTFTQTEYLRAFDQEEELQRLSNWLFLTGTKNELQHLWDAYGCEVQTEPGGAMVAHSDLSYVIDRSGHVRYSLDADPGPGTEATKSSFAAVLSDVIKMTASQ
jgi:cytochrome oxidase Cu insertion factor (SCO1/SenC/PrrC family)